MDQRRLADMCAKSAAHAAFEMLHLRTLRLAGIGKGGVGSCSCSHSCRATQKGVQMQSLRAEKRALHHMSHVEK